MSDGPRFTCEACGKSYPWKAQYAGKKVKCTCGAVMVAPSAPPAAAPPEEADLYGIAEDPTPPKKPARIPVAKATADTDAGLAPAPATPAHKSKPSSAFIAYAATAKSREVEGASTSDFENQLGGETWRELYMPSAMVIVGLALNVLLFMHSAGGWVSPRHIMAPLTLTVLFNLVLSFIGVLIVSKLFEISFGHPGTAILKLTACVLLPTAIAGFAGNFFGHDSAFVNLMTRAILMFPLTLVCVMVMFQLALDESIWVVCAIYIITDWVTKFILAAMITTGSTAGAGAIVGTADLSAKAAPQSRSWWVQKQIDEKSTIDAMPWIQQGDRTMGRMPPAEAIQILANFKAAGATTLQFYHMYTYRAGGLFVGLPKDKTARDNVINIYKQMGEKYELFLPDVLDDDTYLIIETPCDFLDTSVKVAPDGGLNHY